MNSTATGLPVLTADFIDCDPGRTVCFTGHRPGKIRPYRDEQRFARLTQDTVRLMIDRYVQLAVESGCDTFISGLAQGVDLWGAESVVRMKSSGKNIRLIGAMPFIRHCKYFKPEELNLLRYIEKSCDQLLSVSPDPLMLYGEKGLPHTSREVYADRNRFMIGHSDFVIAFFDKESESRSGTGQTLRMAKEAGKTTWIISSDMIHRLIDTSLGDPDMIRELVGRTVWL